ncbi:MAG TPA: glycosyltransferase family A protein [Gemmatimonadaceae bacterium]|nr:glycosyltransferase family A protein [Gemmatimonadaceae bacterium]
MSVVIPAFNASDWMRATLASVTSQSWKELEVVVVDDGSFDSTADIVEVCRDSRVRLIKQENKGAAAARNRGVRETGGDFVQFLDADDLLGRDKIRLQVESLNNAEENAIASAEWGRFVNDENEATFEPEPVWTEENPVSWIVRSMSGEGMMQPAAWLTPRSLITLAGKWDETLTLHDDGEYFTRVLLNARRNVFVPGARVYYRDVESSLSRRRGRAAVVSAFSVSRARHAHLLAVRDDNAARRAIATQYAQFVYEHGAVAPDLMDEAMRAMSELDARPLARVGGRVFRGLTSALGFRSAMKLRMLATGGRK